MNNRSYFAGFWGEIMPIRQLAPDVAAKIAAGEVVERPASVVKELIENSIDAGSTGIRVDLSHGGLQLIRVTDNGSGIPIDELPLALQRHATSKVALIGDLEHIRSLGFRGEALASIAAVAEVTLLSRKHGTDEGAQIEASGGIISQPTVAASPEGTTITVRNLFSAVPARLKFLKSRNTEVSHCHHLLEQYVLAYPEIRFSVFSDGRQIFSTPGDGQLASVLVEVYGLQIAQQMIPVQEQPRADDPSYPVVSGYVSRPTCYKSTRQYISFFVNRRWVLSRMLTAAVEGGYHSLLLSGRHPIAVINVEIDPTLLDVNVHPAKTEIRFLKERRVFAAILRAVRDALLEEPAMPQWQPGEAASETSTPENASSPASSTEIVSDEELEEDLALLDASETRGEAHQQRPTDFPRDNPWLTVTEEESGSKPPVSNRLWQSHVQNSTTHTSSTSRLKPSSQQETAMGNDVVPSSPTSEEHVFSEKAVNAVAAVEDAQNSMNNSTNAQTLSSIAVSSPSPIEKLWGSDESNVVGAARVNGVDTDSTAQQPRQTSLLAPEDSTSPLSVVGPQARRHFPRLRVVGQVAQSYIVTEGEDGMYLIDQHAAHERIVLERMVSAMKTRSTLSQLLLTPIKLALAPSELEAIEEHQQELERIGFAFEFADDSTLEVKAVPSVLVKQMNARSLHELLLDTTSAESLGDTQTWEERALANVACKAAIKANYFLTVSEMREMLEQLEQTQAPFSCCHGRPTTVHFGLTSLSRAFERR